MKMPKMPKMLQKKDLRNYKSVKYWVGILLLFVGFFAYFATRWIFSEFGPVTMESMLFSLFTPMAGADSYVFRFLFRALLPAVVLCVFFLCLFYKWISRLLVLCFGGIIAVAGVLYFSYEMNLGTYIENQFDRTAIYDEYYVSPEETSLTFPQEKRNLVYIYMESMEATYKSREESGYMEENLIPGITRLQKENICFQDEAGGEAKILSNCVWTMAAMTAMTSGIPLSMPFGWNGYSAYQTFLPGLCTLGDILEEEGYEQKLVLGSDSKFSGTNHMFEQHGNYEIVDYNTAIEKHYIPEDYFEWWGVEDAVLYEIAKQELTELAGRGKPFNFTMATMDTHTKNGYFCKKCKANYPSNYSNVIACADSQVYEFIRWIQEQPFYENTTIIVAGDHKSMDPNYFKGMDSGYHRTTVGLIINPMVEGEVNKTRNYSTLDMFPTTLAALGVQIEGDRLGLGTNLFSDTPTLVEELGESYLNKELLKISKFYEKNFY